MIISFTGSHTPQVPLLIIVKEDQDSAAGVLAPDARHAIIYI